MRAKGVLLVLLVAAIIMSLSRGAMLGLVAGLGILGVLWRWSCQVAASDVATGDRISTDVDVARPREASRCGRMCWKWLAVSVCLLAIGFVAWQSMPAFQKERLASWEHASNARRPHIYRSTIDMIKDKPWLGFGFGTYEVLFQEYKPPELARLIPDTTMILHAHNDLLQMVAETGVLGGSMYLLIWLFYLAMVLQSIKNGHFGHLNRIRCGLAGGLAAVVVHNMFNVDSRYVTVQVLTVITLACSATLSPPLRGAVRSCVPTTISPRVAIMFKILVSLAIALLLVTGAGSLRRFRSSILLQRADRVIETGPWSGMETAARQATKCDPHNTQAWYELGYACSRQENWGGAVEAYRKVKRCNPNWANVDANMANCYAYLGDWQSARKYASDALRIHPYSEAGHFLAGKANYALDCEDTALDHFNVFLSHNPDHAEALFYSASILESLGMTNEASVRYGASRVSDPEVYRHLSEGP